MKIFPIKFCLIFFGIIIFCNLNINFQANAQQKQKVPCIVDIRYGDDNVGIVTYFVLKFQYKNQTGRKINGVSVLIYDNDGKLVSMKEVSLQTIPADNNKVQSERYKISSGFYPVPSNIKETILLMIRLFAKLILKTMPNFISNPIRRIFSGWYRKRFVSMSEK